MRIAIVGPSGSGKDTLAEYLSSITPLQYKASSSYYLCRYIASHTGIPFEVVWRDRHTRKDMQVWSARARHHYAADLIKSAIRDGNDIVTGTRAFDEFETARRDGLFDLSIYVVGRDVPHDRTLEIDPGHADLMIWNGGTLGELFARVERLANVLNIWSFAN